jgi:hypothetical protein
MRISMPPFCLGWARRDFSRSADELRWQPFELINGFTKTVKGLQHFRKTNASKAPPNGALSVALRESRCRAAAGSPSLAQTAHVQR